MSREADPEPTHPEAASPTSLGPASSGRASSGPARRTVIVTGASSGIGEVAAARLAAAGDDVAVVGRDPERTRAVAERIGATAFLADFERLDDVRALADALLQRYERIDVLAKFVTPTGKIEAARRTGASRKQQTRVVRAVKRARYLALLPFTIDDAR